MHQIIIEEIVIDVTRKNIKNIRLSVKPPDGRVYISTPFHIENEVVEQFAISNLAWIKKHQARFQAKEPFPKKEFFSGKSHYFQGKPYLLNVIYHNEQPKVEIRNNTYIDLYVKEGSDEIQCTNLIMSWYRNYLNESIPQYIKKWQPILNLQVNEWGVKSMKTRWGSCNVGAKRIWLSLELAKKDPLCLEYVIVHEMAHILEPNHGKGFIALMDKFIPNWRNFKDDLNKLL